MVTLNFFLYSFLLFQKYLQFLDINFIITKYFLNSSIFDALKKKIAQPLCLLYWTEKNTCWLDWNMHVYYQTYTFWTLKEGWTNWAIAGLAEFFWIQFRLIYPSSLSLSPPFLGLGDPHISAQSSRGLARSVCVWQRPVSPSLNCSGTRKWKPSPQPPAWNFPLQQALVLQSLHEFFLGSILLCYPRCRSPFLPISQ